VRALEQRRQRATLGEVEPIHGARDVDVAVGVEAVDELVAAIVQIALYFELIGRAHAAAEFFAHAFIGHIRDVAYHAGESEAAAGGLAATVVVAAVPIGIRHDGLAADFIEADLLRAVAGGAGDGDRGGDAIGIRDGPFERLHPSHGTARDGEQARNFQVIDEQLLQAHHV
jgi:hypothetical protein